MCRQALCNVLLKKSRDLFMKDLSEWKGEQTFDDVIVTKSYFSFQIFDRDGMFLHKFSVPDLKASTLAVDANRRIIVADSANRCIHVISLDTG